MSKDVFQRMREQENSDEINEILEPANQPILKTINPDSFKISCHAISEIMAGEIGLTEKQEITFNELSAREKGEGKPLTDNMVKELAGLKFKRDNPELPQGAKTHVKKWLKKKLFDRKEDWKSIVVDKGLAVEDIAIDLISKVYKLDGLEKNTQRFSTGFIHGTPDVLFNETVRDVKSSWDLFTFPMFDDKIPKPEYDLQIKGYMICTGYRLGSLDYALIDTPESLRDLDLKKLYYQSGGKAENWTPADYEWMYPNYTFQDIPDQKRIKSFEVIYDPSLEVKINERVVLCRDYIRKILNENNSSGQSR